MYTSTLNLNLDLEKKTDKISLICKLFYQLLQTHLKTNTVNCEINHEFTCFHPLVQIFVQMLLVRFLGTSVLCPL